MNLTEEIEINVRRGLAEDIGSGDLTALLVENNTTLHAKIISRDDAIVCGTQWFEASFHQLSPDVLIRWHVQDGDKILKEQILCEIEGCARVLLTAERTALNFLQILSAVATKTRQYVDVISSTKAKIVDTRKTLPGLRLAQKYAVKCGGGANHRLGLHDGILIKENHIIAAGGIEQALSKAKSIKPSPDVSIQIEVESLEEFQCALIAGAEMILLDNFSLSQLRDAVNLSKQLTNGPVLLEASGNITLDTVKVVAETGVDRISIGSLTKDVKAIDLSMRFRGMDLHAI